MVLVRPKWLVPVVLGTMEKRERIYTKTQQISRL